MNAAPFSPAKISSKPIEIEMAFEPEAYLVLLKPVRELLLGTQQFTRHLDGTVRIEYDFVRRWWLFPHDRFIQYGPEDEQWARFFGFGTEVMDIEHVVIPHAILKGQKNGVWEFQAIPDPQETIEITFPEGSP